MTSVAEQIVTALAGLGVRNVWGVVGDALNPVTDAIRRDERLEWVGTRHEEVAAFAAGAQASSPEALAAVVDAFAASDAVITAATGMSTDWLSRFVRFVRMSGTRRMLGSFNLGSMANAMP